MTTFVTGKHSFVTPPGLDLFVMPNGEADITTSPAAVAPNSTLEAFGGAIDITISSHAPLVTTMLEATNGGRIAFEPNLEGVWHNDGTAIAANGGSITIALNVIGTGMFLVDPGGTLNFIATPLGDFYGVAATQTVKVQGGTLNIDAPAGYPAPTGFTAATTIDATGIIDLHGLVADSATYDPVAHLVDFVGGGQEVYKLSVTPTAPGGTVKIADLGAGSWALTDPAPAHGGHQPPQHFRGAWA